MSSGGLLAAVEGVCSGDLSVADVPGLQAELCDVRHAINRLRGWADLLLGEIDARGAVDEDGEHVAT